ncbi:hypothetical protein AX14_007553 [Amanita brunnescens Koide BX004]|nr:hypothetical protein AX14_007553 [Amanita brunnescens Koide BX004]
MADSASESDSQLSDTGQSQLTAKKSKGKKKARATDGPGETDPNAVYVNAARWIPLAIDPFCNLEEVFMEGINVQGPPASIDQHYNLIVFEKIMQLVSTFRTYVLEIAKNNEESLLAFINLLQETMNGVKSHDSFMIKEKIPEVIVPDGQPKSNYDVPRSHEKSRWGWYNNVLARLLCPMELIAEFDQDPEEFRAQVLEARRTISAFSWPAFCYDESLYDPSDPMKGLFRGFLLERIYRFLFTGPSTTFGHKSSGRLPCGVLHGLQKPTAETIAYTAVMARWALSSAARWSDEDFGFRLDDFFTQIMNTLDPDFPDADLNVSAEWRQDTFQWWEEHVPELRKRSASKKKSKQVSKPIKSNQLQMCAARKMEFARLRVIDPQLQTQGPSRSQARPLPANPHDSHPLPASSHPPMPQAAAQPPAAPAAFPNTAPRPQARPLSANSGCDVHPPAPSCLPMPQAAAQPLVPPQPAAPDTSNAQPRPATFANTAPSRPQARPLLANCDSHPPLTPQAAAQPPALPQPVAPIGSNAQPHPNPGHDSHPPAPSCLPTPQAAAQPPASPQPAAPAGSNAQPRPAQSSTAEPPRKGQKRSRNRSSSATIAPETSDPFASDLSPAELSQEASEENQQKLKKKKRKTQTAGTRKSGRLSNKT